MAVETRNKANFLQRSRYFMDALDDFENYCSQSSHTLLTSSRSKYLVQKVSTHLMGLFKQTSLWTQTQVIVLESTPNIDKSLI